jgi:FAD/FMN-containing dehydrogenase
VAAISTSPTGPELDKLYDGDTLARLRQVKERYDPDGLFAGGHALTVA